MFDITAPTKYYTVTEYALCFDDGANNGFSFPCDRSGKLLEPVSEAAKANYTMCLEQPRRFVRYNVVVEYTWRAKDNARGRCSCGHEMELQDEYLGACQCGKCGQWYNLWGQELLPPEQWEEE